MLLLSKPFSSLRADGDEALAWAILHERGLRELRLRAARAEDGETIAETTLAEAVRARDAGDVCHVCGNLVTWVDHLPPREPGGAVRCFFNVRGLHGDSPYDQVGVVIDDIFPGV